MNFQKAWLFAAALAALGFAATDAPAYTTRCEVIDASAVDGYVTNESPDAFQVAGQVRFIFSAANSMSRPAIASPANSLVPPGQTVRVAHVKLAFQPQPGETCRFDVSDAVRKP
ncbi:MAG TPA: hypothetical protein VH309_14070 [Elusimicrobiota bacterium]|nr:hypothetical protein [Elusimicrobiota bacterium]